MPRLHPPAGAWASRVAVLTAAVLVLAAANLTLRLDREMVEVWDESLYATTALEIVRSGDWLVTTFQSTPDYYNSKPPLNVWLIAGAFKAFGPGLVSLRLWSALAAWLTVVAVWWWSRQAWGEWVGLVAALVLGTSYPFLYVHSGRSGDPDAMLTLAVTLTFVVLWRAHERPRWAVWAAPLAAVGFMLKGPAALALFAPMVAADAVTRWRHRRLTRVWLAPLALGAVAGAVPVAAWAVLRWQADGSALFRAMLTNDLAARLVTPLDQHDEPWWFFATVLVRHWYDWLVLGLLALLWSSSGLARVRQWLARDSSAGARTLVLAWLVTTLLVPTVVSTKLSWYLNPFYPGAAILVALAVAHAWRTLRDRGYHGRAWALVALVALTVVVAEGRLIYRTRRLDLHRSAQGLLLAAGPDLAGHRVYRAGCPYPEAFLAAAAGSSCVVAADVGEFLRVSAPGDYWLDRRDAAWPDLRLISTNRQASLHQRP